MRWMTWILADVARDFTGCHSNHTTRVEHALDDVAGNRRLCLPRPPRRRPRWCCWAEMPSTPLRCAPAIKVLHSSTFQLDLSRF